MRGAMLCLSADLTTHAVTTFHPARPGQRAAAAVRHFSDREAVERSLATTFTLFCLHGNLASRAPPLAAPPLMETGTSLRPMSMIRRRCMDSFSVLWVVAPPFVGFGIFPLPLLAFASGATETCAPALPRESDCRFGCLLFPGGALAAVRFGRSMRLGEAIEKR